MPYEITKTILSKDAAQQAIEKLTQKRDECLKLLEDAKQQRASVEKDIKNATDQYKCMAAYAKDLPDQRQIQNDWLDSTRNRTQRVGFELDKKVHSVNQIAFSVASEIVTCHNIRGSWMFGQACGLRETLRRDNMPEPDLSEIFSEAARLPASEEMLQICREVESIGHSLDSLVEDLQSKCRRFKCYLDREIKKVAIDNK